MTFNLLVVADHDVCRGPIAAAVLREQLELGPLRDGLHVASRGLAASSEPVCQAAVESGIDLAGHVPAVLSDADLTDAALILTVDVDQRRAVVALDPSARRRCFTISEAHLIADWVVRGSPLPEGVEVIGIGAPVRPDDRSERLQWWVQEMDRSRGLPGLTAELRHDLGAVPGGPVPSEGEAVAEVAETCAALGAALRQLLR